MARSLPIPHPAGRARSQLGLFLGAYLLYTAGRWLTVAELGPATEHAESIMSTERLGLARGELAERTAVIVARLARPEPPRRRGHDGRPHTVGLPPAIRRAAAA